MEGAWRLVLAKLCATALGVIFIGGAVAWETSPYGQELAEEYGAPARSSVAMVIVGLLCLTAAGM